MKIYNKSEYNDLDMFLQPKICTVFMNNISFAFIYFFAINEIVPTRRVVR